MFDGLLDPGLCGEVGDAAVIDAVRDYSRAEAAMAARRLAWLAELIRRRIEPDSATAKWSCDDWDSMTAEAGCAMGVSPRRASTQLRYAEALAGRFPKVAALLEAGVVSVRVVSTIIWRTHLVVDGVAVDLIDTAIAERAAGWGVLSEVQLDLTIDAVLEEHDPQAPQQFRDAARRRDIEFGKPDDDTGTASIWGRLLGTDAALLKQILDEIARTVCPDDPRSLGERRSDAVGALAAGHDRLACRCANPDCAAASIESRAGSVVIHIVAGQAAVAEARQAEPQTQEAKPEPQPEPQAEPEPGAGAGAKAELEADANSAPEPQAEPQPEPEAEPGREAAVTSPTKATRTFKAAVLMGGGVVPTPLLAELLNAGATVQPLRPPGETADPRYRPSGTLQRFVKCRDLTCRFPGCTRPAEYTDIDHTTPHPAGATHAANLKCLCRKHHLLKTFWTGPGGWSDVQHPDGSIVWTAPTGHKYTTRPASQLVFPDWNTTTTPPPPPTDTPPGTGSDITAYRGLMMPKRKRTRAQDRAQRIQAERALNAAHAAERNKPPPIDD